MPNTPEECSTMLLSSTSNPKIKPPTNDGWGLSFCLIHPAHIKRMDLGLVLRVQTQGLHSGFDSICSVRIQLPQSTS